MVAGDTHSFERRLQKLAYRVTLSKAEGLKERHLELIQAHLWAADVTRSLGLGWEPRSRKKSGEHTGKVAAKCPREEGSE